ncbi:hypothetical protein OZL92_15890 [Bacillus sonorensis]|uniref:YbyB n=2 Tax=Bacillus sonorensis TaxID=119858 RepID=M5PC77_9BACI|nr:MULTISPECIES: hypothetical protein [Bacillus]TWK73998.1 hypothetical protein CHCC20335_2283 [Bacillus paralicheniformis]ASB91298.1 uncharacterized protein S101395_04810 [Bacillus sonorensis]EME72662.1 hypothetical protein BSONL12_20375 [Bacillus sonorensis L12]MBG9917364.1 hypothetical protein [Bacillus sonorensis]MCF7620073.1 hypothetical protein [Bacillus sonorensis]
MKQKNVMSTLAVSTVVAGVVSYMLKDQANRQKLKECMQNMKSKLPSLPQKQNTASFPVDKAGNPSPHDIEDNKMVSEGSMYPVQYYDEKKK